MVFNPNKPIKLSAPADAPAPRGGAVRDPRTAFATQIHPDLVMPEHRPPTAPRPAAANSAPRRAMSRRGFLGLAGAAVAVGAAAAITAPELIKRFEEATGLGEQIDAAEARTQATELARSLVKTGRSYFSDELSSVAYPYSRDSDSDNEPYQLRKEAHGAAAAVAGIFGDYPYYDVESGLRLQVDDPAHPAVDGMPSATMEVYCKDKTGAVRQNISTATYTFGELMNWTESALMPKDPTQPTDPEDPNNALALQRIGILTVDRAQGGDTLQVPTWFAVELTEDAVYILKPGGHDQGYDANGLRSKDWLSPSDPDYAGAFKRTMAALTDGLTYFTDTAKQAR